jgi:hypothetical protein
MGLSYRNELPPGVLQAIGSVETSNSKGNLLRKSHFLLSC